MQKEPETEETIIFFVTFLSLIAFQLGRPGPLGLPFGYAYVRKYLHSITLGLFCVSWLSGNTRVTQKKRAPTLIRPHFLVFSSNEMKLWS